MLMPEATERMARREYQDPSVLAGGTTRKYWYIRYRRKVLVGPGEIGRREKQHFLGWCDEMTKRQAEREKSAVMREVNGEVYSIQSHVPFGDFLDTYMGEHFRTIKRPTQNTYRQQIETHIRPGFAGRKLCDLTPLEITRFFGLLQDAGIAKTTRNTIKGILSSVFKRARLWGYVTAGTDPVKDSEVGGGPQRVREKRIPTRAEVALLLESVDDQLRLLIETLMYTGMRISEALGLHWRNVDTDRGVIYVVERYCRGDWDVPKSEKGRRVLPLGSLTPKYAERRRGGDDLVFHENGEPLRDDMLLANVLSRKMVKLGIKFPGFGWHTFRRAHLTWLRDEGATVLETMEQAGHSRPDVTSLYVVDDLRRREALVRSIQTRMESVQ